jgi:SAM-dependent methyltransferase
MSDPTAPNAGQIDYWNAAAGMTWATLQAEIDRQLDNLGLEAMRALSLRPGERVLDIGCGCGATTIQLADRVGRVGAVVGADISRPMLDVARRRTVQAEAASPNFREVDAQSEDLGTGTFDAAFSRFGVMFFSDPIAAFANIHKSLKPAGRLVFVCWRSFENNVWMHAPFLAAAPFLPPRDVPDPYAPGPYAFADADHVKSILFEAGFHSIEIKPYDTEIGASRLDEALVLAFKIGVLGRMLAENPDKAADVTEAVRSELARHVGADGIVRMAAAVWIVSARA